MSDNEQSQQREGKTQTSISRKKITHYKQIDVYTVVFLKESDTSLWLEKIKFLNEPKQLAKQNIVSTRYTPTDVWPLTSQSTALLYFFLNKRFYRTQHIMPYRNNSVKQNKLEDQN